MKKSVAGPILAILLAIGGALFAETAVGADEILLRAAGCKTEYFLVKDLADAYSQATGNKILPGPTGNKKAVELLQGQQVDFAFTCKPIAQLIKGLKLNPADVAAWKSIAIARDPIVVVSNTQNGLKGLTTGQLSKLFQGGIANWKELGGSDLPVLPAYMNPQMESGVVLLFREFTVGDEGKLTDRAWFGDDPSKLGNYVSVTPGAVTFMGYTSYRDKYGDILEIDGVAPTRENIVNGTYGLAATYYLTLDGRTSEGVSSFVQFATSAEGKKVIDQNFISVTGEE